MDNLSEVDRAYLAGFVDGEGCLAINKRKHKNKFGEWIGYSCFIDLTNVNLEVMEFIRNKLNISSRIYENPMKGNRKLAYKLRLNKREVSKLLPLIQKYLIVKRAQAFVLLEFCKHSKDAEKRDKLWEQMRVLNHRGL